MHPSQRNFKVKLVNITFKRNSKSHHQLIREFRVYFLFYAWIKRDSICLFFKCYLVPKRVCRKKLKYIVGDLDNCTCLWNVFDELQIKSHDSLLFLIFLLPEVYRHFSSWLMMKRFCRYSFVKWNFVSTSFLTGLSCCVGVAFDFLLVS